jgi:hypothetical protein
MNVKELIEILKEFPEETGVLYDVTPSEAKAEHAVFGVVNTTYPRRYPAEMLHSGYVILSCRTGGEEITLTSRIHEHDIAGFIQSEY